MLDSKLKKLILPVSVYVVIFSQLIPIDYLGLPVFRIFDPNNVSWFSSFWSGLSSFLEVFYYLSGILLVVTAYIAYLSYRQNLQENERQWEFESDKNTLELCKQYLDTIAFEMTDIDEDFIAACQNDVNNHELSENVLRATKLADRMDLIAFYFKTGFGDIERGKEFVGGYFCSNFDQLRPLLEEINPDYLQRYSASDFVYKQWK